MMNSVIHNTRKFLYENRTDDELLKIMQSDNSTKLNETLCMNILAQDVYKLRKHREQRDVINFETFTQYFERYFDRSTETDQQNLCTIFNHVNSDYDFILPSYGISMMENRYLENREPLQYGFFRIAVYLSKTLDELKHFYMLFATGFLCVSSVISALSIKENNNVPDKKFKFYSYEGNEYEYYKKKRKMFRSNRLKISDRKDGSGNDNDSSKIPNDDYINCGEACKLFVMPKEYDKSFLKQMNIISNIISSGVGVGLNASYVPLYGIENSKENNNKFTKTCGITKGFDTFIEQLNCSNLLSIHERKPKIAVYIHLHCDTVLNALKIKDPLNDRKENVFIGILIPNLFIQFMTQKDKYWYFFDPQFKDEEGRTLNELTLFEYESLYKEWVNKKYYSKKILASELWNIIVNTVYTTGGPYIIWIDNVNKYNNQRSLGPIKTLNLCSEITNYASVDKPSSCTLISANIAFYDAFPGLNEQLYNFMLSEYKESFCCNTFDDFSYILNGIALKELKLVKFCYMLGFLGSMILNNLLGSKTCREIAINTMGVYDTILLIQKENDYYSVEQTKKDDLVQLIAEYIYLGAIVGSCKFSKENKIVCEYYEKSSFKSGIPQWLLCKDRNLSLTYKYWSNVCKMMKNGMANSMLTAHAPTSTVSLLVGVNESVTTPMHDIFIRESGNGRITFVPYGILYKSLKNDFVLNVDDFHDIESQVKMYALSRYFIDGGQSVIFNIKKNKETINKLLNLTFRYKMKNGLYYVNFYKDQHSIPVIRCTESCDSCTM